MFVSSSRNMSHRLSSFKFSVPRLISFIGEGMFIRSESCHTLIRSDGEALESIATPKKTSRWVRSLTAHQPPASACD